MNSRGLILVVLGVLVVTQTLGGHLWERLGVSGNPG